MGTDGSSQNEELTSNGPSERGAGPSEEQSLARNVRWSNLNAIAAALAANMVGPFMGIYALRLGATNAQIGLMSALPALVSLMCAIPGGRLLDRSTRRQATTYGLVLVARMFVSAYALAPLFRSGAAPWFLVLAVAATNLPATLANVSWQSLVANVFPPRGRALALAQRSRLMSLAGILPLLITGRVLDSVAFPLGYQIMFCLAFAVGTVEAVLILRLVEIRSTEPAAGHAAEPAAGHATGPAAGPVRVASAAEVLGNREFMRFALATVSLYLGWTMGGPLFTRYRVTVLGANNTWLSVYSVLEALSAMAAAVFWAGLGERRGYGNVLWWVSAAIAGNVWTLALSRNLPMGLVTPVWCGVVNVGTNLMLFNRLLEIIPAARRATYLAYQSTAANLASMIGPLLGVALMDAMGIRPALFVIGLVRLAGGMLFLLTRPRAPGRPARYAARVAMRGAGAGSSAPPAPGA